MHGFNRHPSLRKVNVSINVSELSGLTDGDEVNLTEMGYDKLLGKGPISKPLNITVDEASPKAIAKVEAAEEQFQQARRWRRLGRMGRGIDT